MGNKLVKELDCKCTDTKTVLEALGNPDVSIGWYIINKGEANEEIIYISKIKTIRGVRFINS